MQALAFHTDMFRLGYFKVPVSQADQHRRRNVTSFSAARHRHMGTVLPKKGKVTAAVDRQSWELRPLPVALGPLEATSTTSCSCSSSSSLRHSPPRGRRHRRVLYPASQSRKPPLREAPDQARRWLLVLSALVFLQIYTEETHTCTELQGQCQDPAASQPQEGEGSLGTAHRWKGEEPLRSQTVGEDSETQLKCVVA